MKDRNIFSTRRSDFIGGSDAVMLMNGEYQRLWRLKTGREEQPDLSNILAPVMGIHTEPLNRFWFTKKTGLSIELPQEDQDGVLVTQISEGADYIGCHPDGYVIENGHRTMMFEAKHTSASRSIRSVVEEYYWQLVHNAMVTGLHKAAVSVFFGNSGWDWTVFEVSAAEKLRLYERERSFWETYVVPDVEPPPMEKTPRDVDVSLLEEKDMSTNNQWMDLAYRLKEALPYRDRYATDTDTIKQLVPDNVRRASGGGVEINRSRKGVLTMRVTIDDEEGRNEPQSAAT